MKKISKGLARLWRVTAYTRLPAFGQSEVPAETACACNECQKCQSAISHSGGWNGTFDRLAEFLLDKIVSQPPELSPAETFTQISSLSDGVPPWARYA
jgi:hypothetical protein